MKAYKVFIMENKILRSVFMIYSFQEGTNVKDPGTPGFYSWSKRKEAERYKEMLVAKHFYTVVIKEVEVYGVTIEKERLYTAKSQKKLKIKDPYGTAICSATIEVKL